MDVLTLSRTAGDRLSASARSIKPSGIRKFFDIVSQRADVISLGIGEPDLHVPVDVRMKAIAAVVAGETRYTPNAGLPALREAIAAYLHRRLDLSYTADEILVTNGVAQGIDVALRAVVDPGDEVLIPEPCFVSYGPCTQLAGAHPIAVPTTAAQGFMLTPEALSAHITPRSRALLLSFPNNPTGVVATRTQLEALVPVIVEHDLTVISDEIYSELTYDRTHVSIAALPGMWERTVVLNGFSKTFAMTGWRLGYAAAPAPLIEGMTRIHQHTVMCAPTISQVAALQALQQVDEIALMARVSYSERRTLLYQGLTSIGLRCVEPQGAFYAFPAVDLLGMSGDEFAELLLAEEAVAVVPGSAFGTVGEGHIRCSYCTHPDKLMAALDRMARFVSRHRAV